MKRRSAAQPADYELGGAAAGFCVAPLAARERTKLTRFQRISSDCRFTLAHHLSLAFGNDEEQLTPSVFPASVAGSRKSRMVNFMDSTTSPLPSPCAP